MSALSSQGGHSTQVKMRLLVNGGLISVAQMGPDFLVVDAIMVLQVDQSEHRWEVHLPDGISAASKRVAIAASA